MLAIGMLLGANAFNAVLYVRGGSSYHPYWSMNLYYQDDSLCVNTTLADIPAHYVLPALKVKFVIDGELVHINKMYVSFDRNPYSFDILEYRGDIICTQYNLDVGQHELEIIEVLYSGNRSQLITFNVLDDGSIQVK